MEVILREDIRSLGKAGDVVKVSPGFSRNFLFPQKKAVPATKANLKNLEGERKTIEIRREKDRKTAEELGQKISTLAVTLEKQSGEEDKIFGSVSTREIVAQLESQGIKIDKRLIHLKDPIKKLGEYMVEVHLHGDVAAPLKIIVSKK